MKPEQEARVRALPIWTGEISWRPLEGGLSNESVTVHDDTGGYVVRFSRDFPFHHVFRDREVMCARAAHAAGFAPEVVHAEPGLMVSRFLVAKTYDSTDMRTNASRIADFMRRFHREMPTHVSGPGFYFCVFHVIRDYARTLRDLGSRVSSSLTRWVDLAGRLEATQVPMRVGVGHHDLLAANFLDDGNRLWLIDFEYCGFSTPMFDLANATSNCDFSDDEAEDFMSAYFERAVTPAERQAHHAMACASLLREAMWSMVSEHFLDAPGVDYVAYSDEVAAKFDVALDRYQARYGKL